MNVQQFRDRNQARELRSFRCIEFIFPRAWVFRKHLDLSIPGPTGALPVLGRYRHPCPHRLGDRCTWRTRTVDRLHDPITCAGGQRAYTQCLYCSIYCASLRPDGNPVLDIAETEENNDRDGDGDEQGVCHILHREVGYHRN